MRPAAVGLADAVRAAHALGPRGRAAELVLELCGLEPEGVAAATLPPPPPPSPEPDREPDEPGGGFTSVSIADLPSSVRHLTPARRNEPSADTAPPDPLTLMPSPSAEPISFDSLFGARLGDDLLRAAGSVPTLSEHPNVPLLVDTIARGEPLVDIPRHLMRSLANGLHVLVDVGETMRPFAADQQHLVERLRGVIGESAIVSYYDADPARGAGPDRRRRSWEPFPGPSPRRPVLALTDLGCGFPLRAATTRAWLRNSRRWRARGCRVTVFAPVRLERVPMGLRRSCAVLVWDRSPGSRPAAALSKVSDG